MSRLTRFVRTRIAEFSGRQRAPEAGIRHILVTRYNVPMGFSGQRNNDPLDPAWLDHREALFRRFTLPSVARQSVRDFEWVILFHPETPARYYSYLDGVAIVLLAGRKDTIAQLRARYEDLGKVLISSRTLTTTTPSRRTISKQRAQPCMRTVAAPLPRSFSPMASGFSSAA